MGRKLDGIVDGIKMAFVPKEKIKGDTRNRYYTHQLFETNQEYRQAFLVGWGLTAGSILIGGGIVLSSAAGISLIKLMNYLSK